MNSSIRRRRRRSITGALVLAILLTSSACSTDQANKANTEQNVISEGPIVEKLPEQSGIIDTEVADNGTTGTEALDNDSTTDSSDVESSTEQTISSEGIFVGLADSHTIEIETQNGAISLQFSSDQRDKVNSLQDEAKVKFEFFEKVIEGSNDVQNWLVQIEELNE